MKQKSNSKDSTSRGKVRSLKKINKNAKFELSASGQRLFYPNFNLIPYFSLLKSMAKETGFLSHRLVKRAPGLSIGQRLTYCLRKSKTAKFEH